MAKYRYIVCDKENDIESLEATKRLIFEEMGRVEFRLNLIKETRFTCCKCKKHCKEMPIIQSAVCGKCAK